MSTIRNVERHVITDEAVDALCFKAKNLYNIATYITRQEFIKTSKEKEEGLRDYAIVFNYYDLYNQLKDSDTYKDMPSQTSQQTLKIVAQNFKGFINSIKDWKKNPSKYKGRPKLPSYLDKEKGRSVVVFTNQQAKWKEEFIHFPKKVNLSPRKTKVKYGSIKQVRFVPFYPEDCKYVMEVIYEREKEIDSTLDKSKCIGIDLGINNLAVILDAQTSCSTIIHGRGLKSLNRYFNKQKAKAQSAEDKAKIRKLSIKRKHKIDDLMHKASRWIVNYCQENKIGKIIIGKNKGWKQEINIGKVNNQKFVSIPFESLISKIQYKAEFIGIEVVLHEESYTSKIDHLALEPMCKQEKYLGKRVHRGLFKSSTGIQLNADVNGAIGIVRKVAGDGWVKTIIPKFSSGQAHVQRIYLSQKL